MFMGLEGMPVKIVFLFSFFYGGGGGGAGVNVLVISKLSYTGIQIVIYNIFTFFVVRRTQGV